MAPPPSPPYPVGQFTSSSGRTVIQYFRYQSGPCGAGVNCNFRGVLHLPSGFDQVEVFLCGFAFRADNHTAGVNRIGATVNKYQYDAATGALEVGVMAQLATDGQQWSYELTFVVVLTDANAARFTSVNASCAGVGSCQITRTLPSAIPPGMQFIGLGTRNWDLGSRAGPVPVNMLAGHMATWGINPPLVNLVYEGHLKDASGATPMFFEWGAAVIAFDPTEMAPNASPLSPQYTVLGFNTSFAQAWTEHAVNPTGPIKGFLDAFDGAIYFYDPAVDHDLWAVDCAATGFATAMGGNMGMTDYRLFIGDTFGNAGNGAPYSFQMSRAFGFLL